MAGNLDWVIFFAVFFTISTSVLTVKFVKVHFCFNKKKSFLGKIKQDVQKVGI